MFLKIKVHSKNQSVTFVPKLDIRLISVLKNVVRKSVYCVVAFSISRLNAQYFLVVPRFRRFVQSVGAKIHGGWSRAAPQKSIALIARSRYGDNRFRGQFFEDRENTEFKQLRVSAAGREPVFG